jgi:hypothetical protein
MQSIVKRGKNLVKKLFGSYLENCALKIGEKASGAQKSVAAAIRADLDPATKQYGNPIRRLAICWDC